MGWEEESSSLANGTVEIGLGSFLNFLSLTQNLGCLSGVSVFRGTTGVPKLWPETGAPEIRDKYHKSQRISEWSHCGLPT